jgi:hypothetical protein
MDDFLFGSFSVRKGKNWMDIYGRLKKSGTTTRVFRIETHKGKGTSIVDLEEEYK